MAEKEIAQRIRDMSEHLGEEHIARALDLPVDVVHGVLKGTISDEVLKDYDPARPLDVRLVEKKKYVRSRIIGVLSPGGCGATTLTASLASLAARSSGQPVAVLDFNEYATMGSVLGIDNRREKAALYPNILWWNGNNIKEVFIKHPNIENMSIVLGAATTERHQEIDFQATASLLEEVARFHSLTWADCPLSPVLWPYLLPKMDLVIIVLRADTNSINTLWQMLPALRTYNQLDKCVLVINLAGGQGWLPESKCQKEVRELSDMPLLAILPEEPELRKGRHVSKSPYTVAIQELLNEVWSENMPGRKRSGMLNALAGIFGR